MVDHYTAAGPRSHEGWRATIRELTAFPVRLPGGALLLIVAWAIAWSSWEPVRYYTFFPLWLGYILTVDGLTAVLSGTSLFARSWRGFLSLFVVSAPAWWLFEILNIRLGNWIYQLPHDYSWLNYHAQASLAFSTVIPAVFCTAELVRSMAIRGKIRFARIDPSPSGLTFISLGGLLLLAACQLLPDLFFPVVWLGLFFLIDPIVTLLGGRSIASQVRYGRWDTVLVLFIATLWCGFLWEMWNSRSMPRWTYQLPYAETRRLFEMPLLGYGGYFPFGLELYSLYALIALVLPIKWVAALRFDRPAKDRDDESARRS